MRRNRTFIGPQSMGGMVSLWGASSLIKSIQYGTVTIGDTQTTGTTTITSVNLANTFNLYGGHNSLSNSDGSTSPAMLMSRIELTDATTVTATRTTADPTYGRSMPFCVVEMMPGVLKSVQRGSFTQAGANSNTVTITSVNTARSFLCHLGNQTSYPSPSNNIYSSSITLTNATTVTGTVAAGGASNWLTGYTVVEFF